MAKCNPLAYWTLEDTFDYIAKYEILHHPLHAQGYPSIGDAKDTIPIPEDGSVKFINGKFEGDKSNWLDYACERKGRFVGLANKDGSTKTECGIHVEGAEKTFDRDLWDAKDSAVKALSTPAEAKALISKGVKSVVAVYAPWCQFCQKMEPEFEAFAKELLATGSGADKVEVYKFRGDEEREFVGQALNTKSFPTINVITADGRVIKYESEKRDVASFKKFLAFEHGLV
jgi:thiol-disulfide isomerase/thioredoxin